MADAAADVTTVRLLINDPKKNTGNVFSDDELGAFLTLEAGVVKLAAAQAIDTIADNEALVSKVIKDGDLATDGAKVADALRKRAAALRAQAAAEQAAGEVEDGTGFHFGLTNIGADAHHHPELTDRWVW